MSVIYLYFSYLIRLIRKNGVGKTRGRIYCIANENSEKLENLRVKNIGKTAHSVYNHLLQEGK